MENNFDQLIIHYSETDKESNSVKLMSIFLILIFVFVPLAEIVTDFNYNSISYYSEQVFCVSGLDFSLEVLSFTPQK
ncbi:hypothetical protein [Polaribacter porphyrae]|uniref:Uncharacterized protein n=1 Tax=Polaribacter porphyrae TaxID=1137780 RepID=A0A2S7WRZ3_9FLAO|nr:hypothetical protein [Polaribacter porphyrae]PQJ80082.1 hypothetical protein BTO18_13265 [Polaribacter porphyrae]